MRRTQKNHVCPYKKKDSYCHHCSIFRTKITNKGEIIPCGFEKRVTLDDGRCPNSYYPNLTCKGVTYANIVGESIKRVILSNPDWEQQVSADRGTATKKLEELLPTLPEIIKKFVEKRDCAQATILTNCERPITVAAN